MKAKSNGLLNKTNEYKVGDQNTVRAIESIASPPLNKQNGTNHPSLSPNPLPPLPIRPPQSRAIQPTTPIRQKKDTALLEKILLLTDQVR